MNGDFVAMEPRQQNNKGGENEVGESADLHVTFALWKPCDQTPPPRPSWTFIVAVKSQTSLLCYDVQNYTLVHSWTIYWPGGR